MKFQARIQVEGKRIHLGYYEHVEDAVVTIKLERENYMENLQIVDGFKSMQPCDWIQEKVKFPCLISPKLDGVASFNRHGKCVGRSLRAHDNLYTVQKFSVPELHGFCGEKVLGTDPTLADLCRVSSGALRRIEGEPDIHWWLFDYCTEETKDIPYISRMVVLNSSLKRISHLEIAKKIHVIEGKLVHNMEELLEEEDKYLNLGYEGAIIRDPYATYKYGRCGKTFMGAWRIKRFIDGEFLIEEIIEGKHNANEAKVNLLGRTERSTNAENMQPNGMLGTLRGTLLKDIVDPQTEEVLLKEGLKIDVAPGKMNHDERKYYFENQHELLMKIGKFKLFPKGTKDKPRFAQFQCIRNENDM